jgi:hypothetical protein
MTRDAGERRHDSRVPIAARVVRIQVADGRDSLHEARVVDLSPTAIGIVAPDLTLDVGTLVNIELERRWWRHVTVPGVVCRIAGDGARCSVRFAAETRAARRRLYAFVRREQKRFERVVETADGAQLAESLRRVEIEVGPLKAEGARVIVMTSARAVSGKGALAAGLSVVLAANQRRVLLVEVEAPAAGGSIGDATVDALTIPICRGVDLLTIDTGRFGWLLRQLGSSRYQYAIVNAPPVLDSASAMELARSADDVFVVAESSVSTERDLIDARDLLARGHAPLRGVILSDEYATPPAVERVTRRPAKEPSPRDAHVEATAARIPWKDTVAIDPAPANQPKVAP